MQEAFFSFAQNISSCLENLEKNCARKSRQALKVKEKHIDAKKTPNIRFHQVKMV